MRVPRLDYPNARHHVMNRGGRHGQVFQDDDDCRIFMELLSEFPARHGVRVHGYALMPNHYHLMVESVTGQLSQAMQDLSKRYTLRHNARHGCDGPIFRGRFRNRVVGSDAYWRHLLAYLHLNFVRAGLGDLQQAEWTSHRYYSGEALRPAWLTTAELQQLYGAPANYLAYIHALASGASQPPADFNEKTLWQAESTGTVAVDQPDMSPLAMERALAEVCAATSLTIDEVLAAPRGRGGNPANWLAAWWLSRRHGFGYGRIGSVLNTPSSAVRSRIERVDARRGQHPQLTGWIERLWAADRLGRAPENG